MVFLAAHGLEAQTSVNYTSYLIKDDNAFKNKEAYDEWINNSQLLLGHRYKNDTYQIQGYYSIKLLQYANNSDLSNYAHKVGFSGVFDTIFENRNYSLDVRASARFNKYQERYIYYNVNGYTVNASILYNPSLDRNYSFGVALTKNQYEEFSELNNNAFRIFGKYQRFFQSRTSITGEIGLGSKKYENQSIIEYYGYYRYTEEPVMTSLISLSGGIGQSITSSFGINLGFGIRRYLLDPIASLSEGIYYYTENDLYDDPYSYQDRYLSLQLTKQFGIGFQGKIGSRFQYKDYAGTPALDENAELIGETREDTRREYFLMVSKKFKTKWHFPKYIDVFVNYMYRSNPSNDPYFNFEDNVALMGFSVGL